MFLTFCVAEVELFGEDLLEDVVFAPVPHDWTILLELCGAGCKGLKARCFETGGEGASHVAHWGGRSESLS